MIDYTAKEKERKGTGCLSVFLIILLILIAIGGSIYLFLPKIISSALSGGTASIFLPEGIRRGTEDFQSFLKENISQMEKVGISTEDATQIISSLEYETIETIFEEIDMNPPSNTSQLIDMVSEHVDLSAVDIKKIKDEYYSEFSTEDIQNMISRTRDSPLMMKSGFRLAKETILNVLSNEENFQDIEEIEKSSSGSSTTKKKK